MSDTEQIRSRLVARKLSESIGRGEVAVGSYLPSTRALASQFGVSLGTVQVALRELQTQSLVECLPRRGTVVRQVPSVDAPVSNGVRGSLIGIVGPRIADYHRGSWEHAIMRAAGEYLFKEHLTMAQLPWYQTDGDFRQIMLSHLDRLGESLAGVLTWVAPELDVMLGELDRRNIPWVTVSRLSADYPHNFVEADNLGSMRLMGRCCALNGYHRVAFVTSSVAKSYNAMNKITGFYQGFLEAGVSTRDIEVLAVQEVGEADGYRAVRQYLADGNRPQVFVTFGDMLGVGALRALHEAGIKVPEQVGVIAGTGTELAAQTHPTMTVVAQPMAQMRRMAAEMLGEMIRDDTRRLLGRRIPCELIFRESFAMPPALADEIRKHNERSFVSYRPARPSRNI